MVGDASNDELIASAAAVLNPHKVGDRLFGDVGCTLVTVAGHRYSGVSIDTSGTGFCAEQAAIAAMVTAGEYQVAKIVAVWRDTDGTLYVLPACGHCGSSSQRALTLQRFAARVPGLASGLALAVRPGRYAQPPSAVSRRA